MADQYDSIADVYEQVKRIPIGLAETTTLVSALPDLNGKSVLDVGCGAGYYPRLFRSAGARRVAGVDAAQEMIAHAQRVEERDPIGISYELYDAAELPVMGAFDVVTAIWLLGYAPGADALDAMVTRLAANLVPGGELVVLFPNPDVDWDVLAGYSRYGMTVVGTGESAGRLSCTVHVEVDPPFDFESFYWPPGVVEATLERGGFTGLTRYPVVVPAEALAERGEGFWADLLACPTFAVYRAKLG
ncbi:class I SAM-dependent methyltransferase [Amycolatopsis sp. H20-H5]|uniref:class I SAM-dependent methyltransferase n=1 Tax=Amycolatopsis sp. H20-H5 TaxID=3046309 RepID=UPI002DB78FD9|nr:class I SAM-dependent methyltransferase [Amycolatopsis sp. H20-H5]MEC3974004.1 class I SAM-dependent methyltransferase [Amycolatopsis sp. H20-H5]